MISSAARGALQTLLAVSLLGDSLTTTSAMGIALILAGSSYYTWEKSRATEDSGLAKKNPT